MIYVMTDEDDRIIGAVNTRHIIGFEYDGTSPSYDSRYILKLDWGHTLMISALAMQNILSAMRKEESEAE